LGVNKGRLIDFSDEDWDEILGVHLKAQFMVLRAAARHWRLRSERGEDVTAAIVNTSPPAALAGFRGVGAYSAAKAAVLALTITAADELADDGVTVNAVVPGAATRLTDWSPGASGPEPIAPSSFGSRPPMEVLGPGRNLARRPGVPGNLGDDRWLG
jgi:NAD(P)-dependent dehydrogenase (short-subunit alcohol dehydrogenase family)